ncbi:Asp23/Gls24 family envelope stress response protein [Speluncibacter jeojiensis]|uniref:Asp23/Gls24 family envelope stress response protein n=1 Tax=Speluncibacter jeojiensis TaxID=2710754 RepID=A0A9X4REI0_9ACTN|nr:Asp23/Gls24 family envelope stress response protein [Corynebacteriales bacterium D3-21]
MAESSAADAPEPDPGERGGLTVKERVVDKIAVRAALSVPGVVRQGSGLSRLTGRELPRTLSVVTGGAVAVGVHIAVAWPCSLAQVADSVQRAVTDQLRTFAGLPVSRVDVSIVAMVPPEQPDLPAPTDAGPTQPGPTEPDPAEPDLGTPDPTASDRTDPPRPTDTAEGAPA